MNPTSSLSAVTSVQIYLSPALSNARNLAHPIPHQDRVSSEEEGAVTIHPAPILIGEMTLSASAGDETPHHEVPINVASDNQAQPAAAAAAAHANAGQALASRHSPLVHMGVMTTLGVAIGGIAANLVGAVGGACGGALLGAVSWFCDSRCRR